MPELLKTLREQTRHEHESLELELDLFHRITSRAAYRKLLEGFLRVHRPLEHELATAVDWQALGWDFDARRKTAWLVEDLAAMGDGMEPGDESRFMRPEISLHTLGGAIGCLYVMEGSTLGGQVISRHLEASLHITPENGGRFFHGYGPRTVEAWRAFGTWVGTQEPNLDASEAVTAARETFQFFQHHLMIPHAA